MGVGVYREFCYLGRILFTNKLIDYVTGNQTKPHVFRDNVHSTETQAQLKMGTGHRLLGGF